MNKSRNRRRIKCL